MERRNTHSCQCGFVTEMLSDPGSGLVEAEDGAVVFEEPFFQVLSFCHRCGGRLPNLWRRRISDEERERLQQIIDGITSAEDAIEQLGPGDYDAYAQHWDSIGGSMVLNEGLSGKLRNIEYYHLSTSANLEFYFSEGSAEGRIVLKFTEEELRQLDSQPEPYEDGTDNGNEPAEVVPHQENWVKCPNCGWRFRLDYAGQSGEWPMHPRCGQRLQVKAV